ncbi:hypothetical protein J7F03_24570 [Streptomyces sp. ISL-43]|uniref:hypothetical protein n=1 Tax=Streptomyces sp. ISL-43 TaxID=2819183 RepID=UPI001BEB3EBE|nr:hypothetical protein [Streptomyces sp. ISL-43]MBT2450192.1 hypothetical protein [Streptomyces sp. ISL-43]
MGTRRTRSTCTGLALAGGLLATSVAAAPAQADPGGSAARGCKPSIQVLETLPATDDPHPSPWVRRTQVSAIAPGPSSRLAVGMSSMVPVYWIGTRVFAVPVPAGSGSGRVADVNRSGLMVGQVSTPDGSRAFSYRHGDRAVTLLPGGDSATGINDRGVIVGQVWDPVRNRTIGLEWSGDRIRRELPPPAGYRLSFLSGVNNRGQVAGNGDAQERLPGAEFRVTPGLYWPADPAVAPSVLRPVDDTGDTYVTRGIADSGRIVGYQRRQAEGGSEVAVVWKKPDGPPVYAPWAPGAMGGTFEAISPNTDVSVGLAEFRYTAPPPEDSPEARAQYWTGSGPMRVLPGLAPSRYTAAFAVTDDDRVGGAALDAEGRVRPVIWTCAAEQAFVLPAVQPPQRRPASAATSEEAALP